MKINFLSREPKRLLIEIQLEDELKFDGLQMAIKNRIIEGIAADYIEKNSAKIIAALDLKAIANLTTMNAGRRMSGYNNF